MLAILQIGLASAAAVAAAAPVQDDPRVRAFVEAYGPLIDSVSYRDGDVVFSLPGGNVHFEDGRMLEEGKLHRRGDCDPIFYRYPLDPLRELPPSPGEFPTACRDVVELLWGRTETEIRRHGSTIGFLDHRMFVNDLLIAPLAAVERDIRAVAARDQRVAQWIEEIEITYSFVTRHIADSGTRSYHAWGMAFDLVPTSYGGRHAYWKWSQAMDPEGWYRIPVEKRWSPPPAVVEIFEKRGFVWGGKWTHFDMIHFEYRPEILLYNRFIEEEE